MLPLVPYASLEEYDQLKALAFSRYWSMVQAYLEEANLNEWCTVYEGISPFVLADWEAEGMELLLTLTKGEGLLWCDRTNEALIRILDTTVHTVVLTRQFSNRPISGLSAHNKLLIQNALHRALLRNWKRGQDMFCELMEHNFVMISSDDNDVATSEHVPWWLVQERMLAFAMCTHPRLGQNSLLRTLGLDMLFYIVEEWVGRRWGDEDCF